MPAWLRAFRASFTFLTRIPVGGFPYPKDTWKWISLWFPLVGLVLGALGCLILWGLPENLSYFSRAAIVVAVGMLLTGGFHEDGLADTADALGGAYDRENLLRILKDSRVGAFGAMALGIVVLIRVSLLADLAQDMFWGLLLGQSLSRAASTMQLALFPYVDNHEGASKSKDVAVSGPIQFVAALFWTVALLAGSIYWGLAMQKLLYIVAVMSFLVGVLGWRYMKRAQGLTGDFLGATQQLTELGILVVLVGL